MEKILKENEWSKLYEITEPFTKTEPPYVFVELGVKNCPKCDEAYYMRFENTFKCDSCGFEFKIRTPFITKIKNIMFHL